MPALERLGHSLPASLKERPENVPKLRNLKVNIRINTPSIGCVINTELSILYFYINCDNFLSLLILADNLIGETESYLNKLIMDISSILDDCF